MKVTCDREKLLNAFQTVASVIPARSPKTILQNVKFEVGEEKAVLMATDLEIGIRYEVPGVEVHTGGAAILPGSRFGSILRESPDDSLLLETDAHGTTIKAERSQFRLPGENPDEFPVVSEFREENHFELPARLLREMIRRTHFATDNESSRYALGGVLLEFESEKVTAVSTDGRRLAKMEAPLMVVGQAPAAEESSIIPARGLQLIERALSDADAEVQLAARSNEFLVKSQRATIYSRLLEGRFPRWRDVFPPREGNIGIEVVVGALHSAVRQAAIATSEESRGVDFTFGNGMIELTGQAADVGEARVQLPIAYDGEEVSITLDPRFFIDFLKVLDPEKTFRLELKDAESAAVSTTDDGYAYIIMPLARDRA